MSFGNPAHHNPYERYKEPVVCAEATEVFGELEAKEDKLLTCEFFEGRAETPSHMAANTGLCLLIVFCITGMLQESVLACSKVKHVEGEDNAGVTWEG